MELCAVYFYVAGRAVGQEIGQDVDPSPET